MSCSIPESVPPPSSSRIESLLGLPGYVTLEMVEYRFVIGLRYMAAKPRDVGKKAVSVRALKVG